jgi:GNAT superfamily N-acetyltransferase
MIRRATVGDRTALLALIEAFCEIDRHPYDRQRVVTALDPLLLDDSYGQVWVVDDSVHVVGYAVLTWSYSLESGGRDCILDELFVTPRSEGLGSELLEAVMSEARRAGAGAMFLETERHNQRVRAFYGRHGFDAEDSVWMSRTLTPVAPDDGPPPPPT